ncbi:GNAT family N-acetyltransferase [Branchiibius sp. NY16-3462-2]|uniref:GNAT family N-acetyltransferase n=1 Tax=Branchiibius sp. NY16-3462-2 TaxID=1807500 RepID=UPI0025C0DFB9|nr:GNAT family N-acetyltransferase [Branchiibius sp. NY16-3462-2]
MSWWSGPTTQLAAHGVRVRVAPATSADVAAYREAVRLSKQRIGQWNPVNAADLEWHLTRQSPEHRTFLIHALDPAGSHGIVGKVNVTNVVRGRFDSGTLGYDAYDPYAGRGLFAEGLRLVIGLALTPMPDGMGLHRVEANVRPGNERSAGLLRSLGFRREGTVRRMLRLDGPDGQAWRDHDMHALTIEEWPGTPYVPHEPERVAVLVDSSLGADFAYRLGQELGVPLFDQQVVPQPEVISSLMSVSPVGAVVCGSELPTAADLHRAGFDPARTARVGREPTDGVSIQVDTTRPIDARRITAIALRCKAIAVGMAQLHPERF